MRKIAGVAGRVPGRLSIIIPLYRSAETIAPLVEELVRLYAAGGLEIVLVNDGSPDDTEGVCLALVERFPDHVIYVALARNFSEHNAVMTGLRHATGDWVVTMDDDLQNPPGEVEKLLAEARRGFDVVYASFREKRHSVVRNLGSRVQDRLATLLLGKPRALYLSTFRCLSRFAVDQVTRYTGPFPYVDALLLAATDSIAAVEVEHAPRPAGRSGYTIPKLLAVWLNMSTASSILPLRVMVLLGLVVAGLGLAFGVVTVVNQLLHPDQVVGWASLMTAIVLFAGVQLVLVGTVGEYVGRTLLTVSGAPQGVVRRVVSRRSERQVPSREGAARQAP